MEFNLDTKDTNEYAQWLHLLEEIQEIHRAVQSEPNTNGLKMARSMAYNILADLHDLIDQTESNPDGKASAPQTDHLELAKVMTVLHDLLPMSIKDHYDNDKNNDEQ